MTRLRSLLMGLAASSLALLALEGALRLALSEDDLLFSYEKPESMISLDKSGHILVKPNSQVHHQDGEFKVNYQTNNWGFRESDAIPLEAPEGQKRILALGDSWMFGVSARQGKSLPSQLERRLGEPGEVEVINASASGYSAYDMLRTWRQYGWQLQIDGLLLGLPHNETRQKAMHQDRRAWYSYVRGAPRFDSRIYLGLRRLIAPYTRPQYVSSADRDDEIESAIADMVQVAKEARGRGLPIWMVLWPTSYVGTDYTWSRAFNRWMSALSPYGVKFTGHRLAERSCWGFEDLHHPSEAGYAAIADKVAELIQGDREPESLKQGSLPASPQCSGNSEIGPGKAGVDLPYAKEARRGRPGQEEPAHP